MFILLLWYHQRQKECWIDLVPMLLMSCSILFTCGLSKFVVIVLHCLVSILFILWTLIWSSGHGQLENLWKMNHYVRPQCCGSRMDHLQWSLKETWCGLWQIVFSYKWCAYWLYNRQGCVRWDITFFIFSLISVNKCRECFTFSKY